MDQRLPVETTLAASDPRMRKTRAALNAAMLSLIEEKPFDQITIRDIAARAQVGYATFFRHFETREALLHALVADEIGRLMALAVPALRATDSQAAALALCTFVAQHRRLWTALLTGGAAGIVREEFVRLAAKTGEAGPLPGGGWMPAELATIYGVSATVEILAWWLQRGHKMPVRKVAEIINRLVITPFVTPESPAPKARMQSKRGRKR